MPHNRPSILHGQIYTFAPLMPLWAVSVHLVRFWWGISDAPSFFAFLFALNWRQREPRTWEQTPAYLP